MSDLPLAHDPSGHDELHPQLLYRTEDGQARFATWALAGGQESLAIFTTIDTAEKYRAELPAGDGWTTFQPPRDKLLTILEACQASGIRHAALDPLGGAARTLFDISQVLAAGRGLTH